MKLTWICYVALFVAKLGPWECSLWLDRRILYPVWWRRVCPYTIQWLFTVNDKWDFWFRPFYRYQWARAYMWHMKLKWPPEWTEAA